MAYLEGRVQIKTYTDNSQTEFPVEFVPFITKDFFNSSITEIQATSITLDVSASQVINLNGVGPVKRFYFFSNATDVLVNINGLGNITFQVGEPAYVPATTTSLTITNSSASTQTTVTLVLMSS